MPLKVDDREEPQLNLTPLVDVLFLLLIFFLVGTQFTEAEDAFEVDLPEAAAAGEPLGGRPEELVVNVGAEGQLTLLNEPIGPDRLRERLAEVHAAYPDQTVVIRGDGAGAYRHVVGVMDAVKASGLTNLALAVRPVAGPAAGGPAAERGPGPGAGR